MTLGDLEAHPRVGGENIKAAVSVVVEWGSSPRGRGKLIDRLSIGFMPRLIPAWAGKTLGRRADHERHPAHPRVGGENLRDLLVNGPELGSSPRGRGKHRSDVPNGNVQGLIPAWAGKTF